MSIVIEYKPKILMPTFNPIMLALTSSNQSEEGYQFIVDVFSASTAGRIARKKEVQNPDGYGVFSLNQILKNYVSVDFSPSHTGMTAGTNQRFKYDLQIGEEYVFNWEFGDNFFYPGDKVGFTSFTSNAHYFSVGDQIYVEQDPGYQFEEYNGVFEIIAIPDQYSLVINLNHSASTADPGTIRYADRRKNQFTGLTSVSSLTVNYAAFSHLDYINYNINEWNVTGGSAYIFCNAPTNYEMRNSNRAWAYAYQSSNSFIDSFIVNTYAENNTLIGTYYLTSSTVNDNYIKIGIGPWNITNTTGLVASGSSTFPVFSDSVYSYDITLYKTGTSKSETLTFTIDHVCTKYNNIELLFVDRKGACMTRNFQLASHVVDNINRSEYKRPIGNFKPVSKSWGYSSYDRGRTVYNTDVTTTYRAISNWMSEDDANYLRELFSSGDVYRVYDGNIIPVIVTTTTYEPKQTINEKLISVEINFSYAWNENIPN